MIVSLCLEECDRRRRQSERCALCLMPSDTRDLGFKLPTQQEGMREGEGERACERQERMKRGNKFEQVTPTCSTDSLAADQIRVT